MIYLKTYKIVYVDGGIIKSQLFGCASRKIALLTYSLWYDFVISCERYSDDKNDRKHRVVDYPQFGFKAIEKVEENLENKCNK